MFRLILQRRRELETEQTHQATKDQKKSFESLKDEEKVKMSYTHRLFSDRKLLQNKILEEGQELVEAIADVHEHKQPNKDSLDSLDSLVEHVEAEAADLFYFALVGVAAGKGELSNVIKDLDKRHLKVKRRPGNAKDHRIKKAARILQQKDK